MREVKGGHAATVFASQKGNSGLDLIGVERDGVGGVNEACPHVSSILIAIRCPKSLLLHPATSTSQSWAWQSDEQLDHGMLHRDLPNKAGQLFIDFLKR
jgi:hypothetical protein